MIPPPSDEQRHAISIWKQGHNQVCSAAAGSGKTTMLLHACISSKEPVCICTYNKQLEIDMSEKLKLMNMEQHHCYTFHGLCSKYYQNTPDDDTMHDVLAKVTSGEVKLKKAFAFRRICIDESQDMKLVFWNLITSIVDVSDIQWFLVGDEVQMLNDYDEDDPAKLDFMQRPVDYFGGTFWEKTRLSTSFRLHSKVSYIVNAMLEHGEHIVPGNNNPEYTRHPVWLCTQSNWDWSKIIIPWLINCRDDPSINRIFILVSKKKGNPPLKVLVNKLCEPSPGNPNGFSIYIHGIDNQDHRVQNNKIIITTWHASKGMQCDAAAVLGVDWESAHNPLHVALSRSRGHLLIVQDKQKPNGRLAKAIQTAPFSIARFDQTTASVDPENISIPVDSDEHNKDFIVNLDTWSPRGRCARLHNLIQDEENGTTGNKGTFTGVQEISNNCWADVSIYYERAAKMKYEFDKTGRCKFMEFMKNPKRVTKDNFDTNIRNCDQQYMLTGRARRDDILPGFAWELLNVSISKTNKMLKDWMTIAICAECWNGFHHNIRQLLPCEWINEYIVNKYMKVLTKNLEQEDTHMDSRLIREESDILFTCRCFAHSHNTTWMVICEDEIPRSMRLLAAIPLALHPTARKCKILNLKTGEERIYSITDKATYLNTIVEIYYTK